MRIELKLYLDTDNDTDLAELENKFYHINDIGGIFVDVKRVDILDVKESEVE